MKKVFLWSCLGCAGLVFVTVASVVLIGWLGSRNAEFTDTSASYEPLTLSEAAESADLDVPAPAGAHRVQLELAGVDEVEIRPCEPGEGLSVDATYDQRRIEFSETMVREDDGGWTYTVAMEGSGSEMTRLLQRIFSRNKSTLDLCLPPDVPIELVGEMARGGMKAELGGLWLTGVDMSMEMGGGLVNFGEPLREPADHVTFRAHMGGGLVAGLGNASPAELTLENSFGGFTADLSGDWKRDALIRIESAKGGSTVILPRSVRVQGAPDIVDAEGMSEAVPVLTFAPGTNFEEVTIQRH